MKRMFLVTLLILVSVALAAPMAMAEWSGQVTTQDGVTVVTNPETPAFGTERQVMREVWRRGGEDDEEVFFGTIAEFLHDQDGNIYLLDGQISEIQVFDPAGELLRTVGRQGEGPGEFQNGADMFWAPNGEIGVVQAWPGKVVMVTADGDPGTTFALPFRDGGGFQSVSRGDLQGEAIVLSGTAWAREGEQQMQFSYLKSYDLAGNEMASYQDNSRPTNFGNYEFIEEEFVDFQRRWDVAPDGRVAAVLAFDEYRIHVWNADGTVNRIIERPDYQKVKRTGDEKAMFQTMYDAFTRWNRGSTFRVNDHHNTVEQILFREDGTLWAQSSAQRWRTAEGDFTSFDVYDREGRFMKTVTLVADADAVKDGLFFAGDRAFVVTDLLDAMMARMGGDGETDLDLEAEPVTVISYEFPAQLATSP
jgi:hypothetical protein|nr:6-bladed beta-propeller [Candidatus Krumholzibacteria bacterium]